MPARALDNMANFVIFNDSTRIVVVKLVASFSITSRVASGVRSRGENPVPPVVRTRFSFCESDHSIIFFLLIEKIEKTNF